MVSTSITNPAIPSNPLDHAQNFKTSNKEKQTTNRKEINDAPSIFVKYIRHLAVEWHLTVKIVNY
jgi:hypothetical protein